MRGDQDPNTRPVVRPPLPWPSKAVPLWLTLVRTLAALPASPQRVRCGQDPDHGSFPSDSLRGPPLPRTHQLLAPRQTLGNVRRVGRRLRRSLRAEAQEQRCCEQVPPHYRVGTAGEPLWIQTTNER
jgi:hypothetical protein